MNTVFVNTAPKCPYCGRSGGEEHHADLHFGVARVSIRCDWCRRRWSVPLSTPVARPGAQAAGKGIRPTTSGG